jgi:hypothetical protein
MSIAKRKPFFQADCANVSPFQNKREFPAPVGLKRMRDIAQHVYARREDLRARAQVAARRVQTSALSIFLETRPSIR